MTLTDAVDETPLPGVPYDSFRVRIAIIRADKGWNYTDAERETGIKAENWRLWEKTDRHPQNYEQVCRQIADNAGYNRQWLMAGGPLRSRCSSETPRSDDGQQVLALAS